MTFKKKSLLIIATLCAPVCANTTFPIAEQAHKRVGLDLTLKDVLPISIDGDGRIKVPQSRGETDVSRRGLALLNTLHSSFEDYGSYFIFGSSFLEQFFPLKGYLVKSVCLGGFGFTTAPEISKKIRRGIVKRKKLSAFMSIVGLLCINKIMANMLIEGAVCVARMVQCYTAYTRNAQSKHT